MKAILSLFLLVPLVLGQSFSDVAFVAALENEAAAAGTTLTVSMVSYWKLGEAAGATRVDSEPTGTAQDLTDNNTVGQTTGEVGNAADFTPSDYLSRADSADLSMGDVAMTAGAIVKIDNKSVDRTIMGKWNEGGGAEWVLFFEAAADRYVFYVRATDNSLQTPVYADAFGSVPTTEAHLVVCSHDPVANTITISVDGGTVNTAAHTLGIQDSTSSFIIGRFTGDNYWDGWIDEAFVAKKVWTEAEIDEFYTLTVVNGQSLY